MGTYEESHLVLAAVRVLESKGKQPPTAEDVAALLEWHPDRVGVVMRQLERLNAIHPVTSPFETRYEVEDHLALEQIERVDQGPGFAGELAEFEAKSEAEKDRLHQLFGETETQRQEKLKSLDKDFASFQKNKPKNPFA